MNKKETNKRAQEVTSGRENTAGQEYPDLDGKLRVKEAAKFIGYSTSFLYKRKEISYVKYGKYIYFDREELIRWLKKKRVERPSRLEIRESAASRV